MVCPPDKAIQILEEDGITVTNEEAKEILEFLYMLGEIVVDQYLNQSDNL